MAYDLGSIDGQCDFCDQNTTIVLQYCNDCWDDKEMDDSLTEDYIRELKAELDKVREECHELRRALFTLHQAREVNTTHILGEMQDLWDAREVVRQAIIAWNTKARGE